MSQVCAADLDGEIIAVFDAQRPDRDAALAKAFRAMRGRMDEAMVGRQYRSRRSVLADLRALLIAEQR